jgi:hypothetical protein
MDLNLKRLTPLPPRATKTRRLTKIAFVLLLRLVTEWKKTSFHPISPSQGTIQTPQMIKMTLLSIPIPAYSLLAILILTKIPHLLILILTKAILLLTKILAKLFLLLTLVLVRTTLRLTLIPRRSPISLWIN